jgi:hypothetical protein
MGMVPRVILAAILLAQLSDAASFAVGYALHGIGLESNGLAVAVYGAAGVEGILLVKGAVIVTTVALLVMTAPRYPRLLVWGGAAATSIGLLGFMANVASLLILGS